MALQVPSPETGRSSTAAFGFAPDAATPEGPFGRLLVQLIGLHAIIQESVCDGTEKADALAGLVLAGKVLRKETARGLQ